MDLTRFINAAVDAVVRSGAEVVILTPPGSSRVEVAKRAGLRVISYKEGGEGWVVARERFVERAVEEVSRGGRWLVIPPDTAAANLLHAALRDKKIVEVLYLPEVYKKIAEEMRLPEEEVKAASVRHWIGGQEKSGVSLKLLRLGEEAAVGAEKIRALAPGRLGLGDVLKEAAKAVKKAPLQYLVDALGEAAAAIPVALVVHGLASAAGLAGIASVATGFAAGLARRTGEEAVKEPLRRAAEWLLQRVTGRREARNEFVQSLAGFVKAALEAKQYIEGKDEDEKKDENGKFESVVDEVAAQWGLDVETFKTFVGNVYKLAAGKIVTEEELAKKLGAIWEEIKNTRKEFREEIAKLKLGRAGAFWLEDMEEGDVYKDVVVEGGRLKIRVYEAEGGYALRDVVAAGAFQKEAEKVASLLRERGFLIVAGPKGIGKSTLAAWLLWRWLSGGEVGVVVRLEEIGAGGGREAEERRQDLFNLFKKKCGKYGAVCTSPLVLYDPSPPIVYARPEAMDAARGAVEEDLKLLAELHRKTGVPVLAVLPSDLLTAEAKQEFGERIQVLNLKDEEFITGLLREYSGCPLDDEAAKGLAARILQFDEGYALIARLAGEKIRRDGCKIGDAEALLGDAQGNALAFIVHYVNRLLGVKVREDGEERVRPDRVERLSRLLAVRQPFAAMAEPGEYVMPSGLAERWFGWEGLSYSEGDARWLAARHHQLVEEALARIADAATGEIGEIPEPLEKALDPWIQHSDKKLREDDKLKEASEAVKYFAEKYGEKLLEELKSQCAEPKCWRRMALMAGAALTWYHLKALAEAVEEGVREGEDVFRGLVEAAGLSGLDRLFLEEGELTPFSEALLIASALPGFSNSVYAVVANRHREMADEAKALWQKWGERGWFSLPEAVYAVGLAALLAKARDLSAEISVEDAEYALRAASFGVQMVLSSYAVSAVIKALSLLGELAPNEWAVVLRNISQIETAVHEDETRNLIVEELDNVAKRVDRDWAKAILAHAYASLGEAKKACSHLGSIKDKALRTLAEAHVYDKFATLGVACPGVDVCKRLGEVAGELDKMAGKLDELKADKELIEYVKRRSLKPEEGLERLLKDALGSALSGSAKCALGKGDFEEAERLFGQAAEISKSLGVWKNYLTDRSLALRAKALASLPERAEEMLEDFEKLWVEALSRPEPTAPYLSIAAGILGDYLVALAFSKRYGKAAELLREHGWLLREDPIDDVAARLALKLLEAKVELPSNKEVFEAVRSNVHSPLLPALAEALRVGWRGDVAEHCAGFMGNERDLCLYAYLAVGGNIAAESEFVPWARVELIKACIPEELLRGADARRLVEVLAPSKSFARSILLMRALASGDVYTARLHAEVGRAKFKGETLGRLFGELADALRVNNQEALRTAVTKLYYYHF